MGKVWNMSSEERQKRLDNDMDVDALDKASSKGGPGWGKGGRTFDDTCFVCGKIGHPAAYCLPNQVYTTQPILFVH